MKLLGRTLVALAIFATIGAGSGVCWAETNDQGSQQLAAVQMERISVTASKVEEDTQIVPMSVSVVSGGEIEEANIRDVRELIRFAPNVYLKASTSENVITMRGITSFETSVYSPTAVYVDDLAIPLHYGHNLDFLDIERVEVLRGPQGSLYGGNSLAGVINIITRQPDNELRARISSDIGLYPSEGNNNLGYNLSASAAGPLVKDRLYLGLSGLMAANDGYTTNLYNDDDQANSIDHKTGRAILRWTPSDQLDISLIGDVFHNDDNIGVYRFTEGPYAADEYYSRLDHNNYIVEDGNSQVLRVSYAWQSMKLLSVTGRRDYSHETLQDYDCSDDPYYDYGVTLANYDNTMLSQEFRLSSDLAGSPWKWLVGAYGMWEDTSISQVNETMYDNSNTDIETSGYALFGEATYTFFGRLHLTGGLRLDVREAQGDKTNTGVSISDEMSSTELLPKISLGFDFTDNAFGYATISKGYLAGGFNYSLAVDDESFTYDPEYTWNYELGVKTAWFNRKLLVNLALFYTQMIDKQAYNMISFTNPTTKVDNAAEAHSYGLELEVKAQPAQGWQIGASLGLTQAEFDDWTAIEYNSDYTALVANDYSGKTIPNVPEYNGSLSVQYHHSSGLFGRADLNVVGGLYATNDNTIKEDPYALVGLRLGYQAGHYEIALWGKNIFNTHYNAIAYDWDGYKMVEDGIPAMVGVSLTAKF
jgi:iron complex outermembrane receptor protein